MENKPEYQYPPMLYTIASENFDALKHYTTRPHHVSSMDEDNSRAAFEESLPGKFKTAVFVGRLQPIHYGHIYVMKLALSIADNLIICIGSANKIGKKDPLTINQRLALLYSALIKEKMVDRISNIVTLPDYASDQIWFEELVKKTGPFDAIVGNNGIVNTIAKDNKKAAIEVPLLERTLLQGTVIRETLYKHEILKPVHYSLWTPTPR